MANTSKMIGVRFRQDELQMLLAVCKSEKRGDLSPSELIRLLVRREYSRRKTGRSVVAGCDYATDHRTGRPRQSDQDVTE